MLATVTALLLATPRLVLLANGNIAPDAVDTPAICLSEIDGVPAFVVPGHEPHFLRIVGTSGAFATAMEMARLVRQVLAAAGLFGLVVNIGGGSSSEGNHHSVTTDFEVWTSSE